MIIGPVTLKNFGSYKSVELDYSNLGLTLVSGPTKAGKSTILDAPLWILFGTTSKDLNADDVKSWFAEEETSGTVRVDMHDRSIFVTRIRGKRPSQNDLFFYVERAGQPGASDPVRGKDAADTQRLLNEELGVDAELYIAASYLHQFTSDKFFTAKAKDRRETMEKIADLSLPIQLGQRASEMRKEVKRDLEFKYQNKSKLEGKAETLKGTLSEQVQSKARWAQKHKAELEAMQRKSDSYEADKEARVMKLVDQLEELDKMIAPNESFDARLSQLRTQIKDLEVIEKDYKNAEYEVFVTKASLEQKQNEFKKYNKNLGDTCPTCLGPANNSHRNKHLASLEVEMAGLTEKLDLQEKELKRLKDALAVRPKLQERFLKCQQEQSENKRLIDRFEQIQAQALALREEENPYVEQISSLEAKTNPYADEIEKTTKRIEIIDEELAKARQEIEALEHKVASLTWLYDKSYELRGLLLERSVKQINDRTNDILERYFDATLRVQLALADSDKLEVFITNEGYDCKYAQLSGGERAMLKLAFSVGYMEAAANTAGVKFETLMLDEAMNGLDASLKVKAFALLQELESRYSSVLLIDHEEQFKQMFQNRFIVTKTGAYSEVERA